MQGKVIAVARSRRHEFSKQDFENIELLEGIGVKGDAHAGTTVQHLSRKAADPGLPNLRQVHLLHGEVLEDLQQEGFDVAPGQLGENITTRALDLLALPQGTLLTFTSGAVIEVTGLRNPCKQIEAFREGLLKRLARRDEQGDVVRLAGIMGIVRTGGPVARGDSIEVRRPAQPHHALQPV